MTKEKLKDEKHHAILVAVGKGRGGQEISLN